MTRPIHWLRRLGLGALSAALVWGPSGCCLVKQEDPLKELRPLGHAVPLPCRNHCYLFCLHGYDPLDRVDLTGLIERLHELGYIKTYEGSFYQTGTFAKEMRRIHQEDPTGRFVLLGEGRG